VEMDIHGYIHVWISLLGHPVGISMDIAQFGKKSNKLRLTFLSTFLNVFLKFLPRFYVI